MPRDTFSARVVWQWSAVVGESRRRRRQRRARTAAGRARVATACGPAGNDGDARRRRRGARARCDAFSRLLSRPPSTTDYSALSREVAAFRAVPAAANPFRVAARGRRPRLELGDLLFIAQSLETLLPLLQRHLPEFFAAVRAIVVDDKQRQPLPDLNVAV